MTSKNLKERRSLKCKKIQIRRNKFERLDKKS